VSEKLFPAMPLGKRKNLIGGSSSLVLSQLKKKHPSGNLKFDYLVFRHFPKLKITYFNEKNPFNFS